MIKFKYRIFSKNIFEHANMEIYFHIRMQYGMYMVLKLVIFRRIRTRQPVAFICRKILFHVLFPYCESELQNCSCSTKILGKYITRPLMQYGEDVSRII